MNIKTTPEWIERMTVVPEVGVAGTFDRIVTMPDGRLLIADLKTGADLSYSWNEIGIQLALYAHGEGLWNGQAQARPVKGVTVHTGPRRPSVGNMANGIELMTNAYDPMPPVDQHEALVMHLPVGEAKCSLHLVDLDVGWEMALTCHQVREWRKRRDTHRPFTDAAPMKVNAERTRTNWIRARLRAIKDHTAARTMVVDMWPQITPVKPPWDDRQINMLDRVLTHVESTYSLPFPEPDPAQPPAGADQFRAMTE